MGAWYEVKNWSEFQHYKERNPPWIKLYRRTLHDPDFNSLELPDQALLMKIWMLSADHDGLVKADDLVTKRWIGADEAWTPDALVRAGFLKRRGRKPSKSNEAITTDASKALAARSQDASTTLALARSRETETETETEKNKHMSPDGDSLWLVMLNAFGAYGQGFKLTPVRRSKLAALWAEHLASLPDSRLEAMAAVCEAIRAHLDFEGAKPTWWLPESSLRNAERREARFREAMDPSLRKRRESPAHERSSEKADRTRRMLESHQAAKAEIERETRVDEGEYNPAEEGIERLSNAWRMPA